MKKINGGHLTAKYLKEVENVDVVFTLSGGHIENILDGLTQYQIKAIDVRHEQTAAMMAHAWTVYRNEPGRKGDVYDFMLFFESFNFLPI